VSATDARIAAALRHLLQYGHLCAGIVCGDRGGGAGVAVSHDDDVCFEAMSGCCGFGHACLPGEVRIRVVSDVQAAIDVQHDAGGVAGAFGAQGEHRCGRFGDRPHAPHGDTADDG